MSKFAFVNSRHLLSSGAGLHFKLWLTVASYWSFQGINFLQVSKNHKGKEDNKFADQNIREPKGANLWQQIKFPFLADLLTKLGKSWFKTLEASTALESKV